MRHALSASLKSSKTRARQGSTAPYARRRSVTFAQRLQADPECPITPVGSTWIISSAKSTPLPPLIEEDMRPIPRQHAQIKWKILLTLLLLAIAPWPNLALDQALAQGDVHSPVMTAPHLQIIPRRAAAATQPYWEQNVGSAITELTTADLNYDGQQELLIATETGQLQVRGADGALLWQYEVGASVSLLIAADLLPEPSGDNPVQELLIGADASNLMALSPNASPISKESVVNWLWSPENAEATISAVAIIQSPTNDLPIILAGAADTLYALAGATGQELWRFSTSDHPITNLFVPDVNATSAPNSSPTPQILIGAGDARDFQVFALNRSGQPLWDFQTQGLVTTLTAADLDGDSLPEVLVGSQDGYAHLLTSQGQELWRFCTAEGITTMAAVDLDGDRRLEILAGALDGYIYALDRAGPPSDQASGLVSNVVQTIWSDQQGAVWFGTPCGVTRYDGQSWATYTTRQGLVDDNVTAIWGDEQGLVWFGTPAGLSRFDGQAWTSFTAEDLPPSDQARSGASFEVTALWGDPQGNIWVGTPIGLYRYDEGGWRYYSTEQLEPELSEEESQTLQTEGILAIWGDAQGRLWFSTPRGVSRYQDSNWTSFTSANSDLPDDTVVAIWGDNQGLVWFGAGQELFPLGADTMRRPLDKASSTNSASSAGGEPSADGVLPLAGAVLVSLGGDAQGQLWAATFNGLFHYDGVNWGKPQLRDDLLALWVDKAGSLWLGTTRGAEYRQASAATETLPVAPPGARWFHLAGGRVQSLAAGDLDGDGQIEIMAGLPEKVETLNAEGQFLWQQSVRGFDGQVSLIDQANNSPGVASATFDANAPPTPGAPPTHSPRAIFIQAETGPVILRQAGQRLEQINFSSPGPPAAPAAFDNASGGVLARFSDMNSDGFGEVVVAAGQRLRLFGYQASQQLEWGLRRSFTIGSEALTAGFGDVDGDNRPEIVVGAANGKLYVLKAGGAVEPIFTAAGPINNLYLANLDALGGQEIVAASQGGRLYALQGQGGLLWLQLMSGDLLNLAVADLDGDGASEVLVGSQDGSIYALEPVEGQIIWQFPADGPISALAAGDVTGDGRPELLAGSENGWVYILAGAADIASEARRLIWRYQLGDGVTSITAADLDGDGRLEVLASASQGIQEQLAVFSGAEGRLLGQCSLDQPGHSLATADLDGDGRLEILVGDSNGFLYILDSLAQLTGNCVQARFNANSSAINDDEIHNNVSVAAVDINDDGQPEALLGTDEGAVYLLSELLRAPGPTIDWSTNREVIGGGVTLAGALDMDGDHLNEAMLASTDGNIYLFGPIFNQPPLLLNASAEVVGSDRTLNYTIDIIDPEGDEAEIWLNVALDPPAWLAWLVSREWVAQPPQQYPGGGRYQLVRTGNPFGWWQGGLKSRYSFSVSSHGEVRALKEKQGPQVPLARQQIAVGLLLLALPLIGWVSQVWQHWFKSPAGQARRLYRRIARKPASLLVEIRRLVDEQANAVDILSELRLLYERQKNQTAHTSIVQGYALVLGRPERPGPGLELLISGLETLAQEDLERRDETLAIYKLFEDGLEANSVRRITALRAQIGQMLKLDMSQLDLPELAQVLTFGHQIIEELEQYEKVSSIEEKIRCLGRAIEGLSSLERVIHTLPEPRRSLLSNISGQWLAVINNALSELRGRADIRVALKQQQLLAEGKPTLALELRNQGSAIAKNIKVELLPSEQYDILEGLADIPSLAGGRSSQVEFRLRPQVKQRLRASFQITYDDAQQSGKVISFADQLHLIKTSGEFKPIENPYVAGAPLKTGSPLFVGREDIFEFIEQNLSGRDQENVLVLIGQRRSGKTSLLKQLPQRLGQQYAPVYIDGQQLGIDPGMPNFFASLSRIIARDLRRLGLSAPAPALADFEAAPSATFEEKFLTGVQDILGERRLVLTFDEFEELEARVRDGKLDQTIFPFLRHLMQHSEKLAFVFIGTHRLEQLTGNYWSTFFNIALHRDIRYLDEASARRLVTQPVADALTYDDLALDEILRITACHPYFLQLVCRELIQHLNSLRRNYVTVEDVRASLDEILERGEAHFRFIWSNTTAAERLVLGALAQLLIEEMIVTSSDIANLLAGYRQLVEQRNRPSGQQHNSISGLLDEDSQIVDPAKVSATLRRLIEQDIVAETLNPTTSSYHFKLDLVRRWIERYRPLSKIIEEVT